MESYRVSMIRKFLKPEVFDVRANSQKEAEKLAKKVANQNYNPSELRLQATDNGFCEVESTKIKKIGYHTSDDTPPMKVNRLYNDKDGKVYSLIE